MPGIATAGIRVKIAEISDYVRDDHVQYPIMYREDNPHGSGYIFYWGNFNDEPHLANVSNKAGARILIVDDDGNEQHYYFMISPGNVNGNSFPLILTQRDFSFVQQWEDRDAKK